MGSFYCLCFQTKSCPVECLRHAFETILERVEAAKKIDEPGTKSIRQEEIRLSILKEQDLKRIHCELQRLSANTGPSEKEWGGFTVPRSAGISKRAHLRESIIETFWYAKQAFSDLFKMAKCSQKRRNCRLSKGGHSISCRRQSCF